MRNLVLIFALVAWAPLVYLTVTTPMTPFHVYELAGLEAKGLVWLALLQAAVLLVAAVVGKASKLGVLAAGGGSVAALGVIWGAFIAWVGMAQNTGPFNVVTIMPGLFEGSLVAALGLTVAAAALFVHPTVRPAAA